MDEPEGEAILHVHLPGLLPPERVLALHRSLSVLVYLSCEQGEPSLQCVAQLTPEEERALVPLLQSYPAYVPYALVWACIEGIPVAEARTQVSRALSQGEQVWVAFMQPVRILLSGLRRTLHSSKRRNVPSGVRCVVLHDWHDWEEPLVFSVSPRGWTEM